MKQDFSWNLRLGQPDKAIKIICLHISKKQNKKQKQAKAHYKQNIRTNDADTSR